METIKELNLDELEQVTGGTKSGCFILGASTGPVVMACAQFGSGSDKNTQGAGVTACVYLGFGIGGSEGE